MKRAVFVPLLLLPALGGCINLGLGNAKTPPALLTLTATSRAVDGSTIIGTPGTALSVIEPGAAAKLEVIRVPVTIDDARVAYLKKAQWVERPSRLFQHLLAETLRASGKRLVVEGDAFTKGQILSGQLLDFGYDVRSRSAVVRFDATRSMPDGTTQTRRFEAGSGPIDADVGQVGPALNEAANKVAHDVSDWIG
ncbi:ABC-type transport auxiliary lipoprotein family protein [Novosphingobium sp.]|uniref:ABC-type transport auxiliary lipoprotein family protein n=1 Tax=Novosphingobium sp. TaxID=1874826 RepID=UPI003B52FFC8